jgi:cell division initiation protein
MELTPNDIRNHQFPSSFRGYNKPDVDAFRENVAVALETARAELLKLGEKKKNLEEKYQQLKNLEDIIKSAVIEAQKNADQIVANAKKEAELLIADAKQKQQQLAEDMRRQQGELESKIDELKYTRRSFYNKLRSETEAHLKLINSIYPPEVDQVQSASAPPKKEEPEPPGLEIKDDDINKVVERFAEESLGDENTETSSTEEEKVTDGNPEENDL